MNHHLAHFINISSALFISALFVMTGPFLSPASAQGNEINWENPSFSSFVTGPNGALTIFGQNEGGDFFTIDVQTAESPSPQRVTGYFGRLFIFMLGFVGVSAFFMVTIGGIQYATSGGNPAGIGAAKDKIWNAILGIILAGTSYLILNLINPALVRFSISVPTGQMPTVGDCTQFQYRAECEKAIGEQNIPPGLNTTASITGQQPGTGGAPGLDGRANPPRGRTPPANVQEFIQQTGGQTP